MKGISQNEMDEFRSKYLCYGVDQESICRNATLSEKAYREVKDRFDALVDDLCDGLVIDFEELEKLSKDIYIAEFFKEKYNCV